MKPKHNIPLIFCVIVFILSLYILAIDHINSVKVCKDYVRDKLGDGFYASIECRTFGDKFKINWGKSVKCRCYIIDVNMHHYLMHSIGYNEFVVGRDGNINNSI